MKTRKIISLILAVILTAAIVCGCTEDPGETGEDYEKIIASATPYTYDNNKVSGTTHSLSKEISDKEFIKNGATEYSVAFAGGSDSYNEFALSELTGFLKTATGIDFNVITDSSSLDPSGKYIYLGRTKNAEDLGYTAKVDEYSNTSAYIVKTNGNAVYLVGGSKYGNLYAVYGFLQEFFNYHIYGIDEVQIDTDVNNLNLYSIDMTEVPDFEYRQTTHGEENYNNVFRMRMRMQSESDVLIPLKGYTYHNWLSVIPVSKYYASHPEWFNSKKTNLNLTSDSLVDEVFNNIKEDILACPDGAMVGFTQEDNAGWGDDEVSNANYKKYGVHSVESVRFLKKLIAKINEWLENEHNDRKLYVFDFAYSNNFDAPVTKKADGTFELMESDLKVDADNGAILVCTFNSNDYYPFESEINSDTKDNIEKWSMVTDNLMSWNYYTNFKNFFLPVDMYGSMQKNNKYLYTKNVVYLYNQFGHTQPMGSDFYRLKEYLASMLAWNVNLDMNSLITDFFKEYYKDASDVMLDFFYEERTWFDKLQAIDPELVYIRRSNNFSADYWPKKLLESWLDKFEECYNIILPLKSSDRETYTALYNRIAAESITIRYLYCKLYSTDMTTDEYNSQHSELINDCLRVGFTRESESSYTLLNV